MIENKITIKGDTVVDIQRGAIGHRATWTGLTYTKGCEAGLAEEMEKVIRQAVSETGNTQGNEIKEKCPDAEDVSVFADTFLSPTLQKTFEITFKTKDKDRVDLEFHHCPLLKAWQDLGFDDATCEKLCDMAMDGDRGIANAMGYEFHLGDTIAKGCKTCEVSFYKKGK